MWGTHLNNINSRRPATYAVSIRCVFMYIQYIMYTCIPLKGILDLVNARVPTAILDDK